MKKNILILIAVIILSVNLFAQSTIGTNIPDDRLPLVSSNPRVTEWQNAGCLKQIEEQGGLTIDYFLDVTEDLENINGNTLAAKINEITNYDNVPQFQNKSLLFYFPHGEYEFDETIVINRDNVVFKGVGADLTILHFNMDYDYYRYTYTDYPETVILRWRYQDCFDLNTINSIGFEDFKLERTDNQIYHEIVDPTTVVGFSGSNLSISGSSHIWISGIHSYYAPRHHVSIGSGNQNIEITGSYFNKSLHRVGGGNGYGVKYEIHNKIFAVV